MHTERNPLEAFLAKRASRPVPLKGTKYDIDVLSGLAIIRSTRLFKNDEMRPIEATMTFPVPFDAAVYDLQIKVAGRTLAGKAQPKVTARETYEEAIDTGKPAVLHEELLRGLHMLSVGNVGPGVEIEVTASYVMPVALDNGKGFFRIPLTVGQIYGNSQLEESDDLVIGGDVQSVDVSVTTLCGTVKIGGKKVDARTTVKSNQPIEVRIDDFYEGFPNSLGGYSPDGRFVSLDFVPAPKVKTPLKMHMLLDTSGSMSELVSASGGQKTKWQAVLDGISDVSGKVLKASDKVTVSTFASHCTVHGSTNGDQLNSYVREMPYVSGGTELPHAVATVIEHEKEANVLLVTDGKSWNKIDIQAAIASGARFTVVLVGEDALEVSVGYLAAMTGGQMFIVRGDKVRKAISAAVQSMRNVSSPITPIKGKPTKYSRRIAGVHIHARWKSHGEVDFEINERHKAIVAFAASLAVPAMEEEAAAIYAAEAGLVTHLTSIVLVDEEAERVEGIPATRKVALPAPGTEWIVRNHQGPRLASFDAALSASFSDATSMLSVNPTSMGGGTMRGFSDPAAPTPWPDSGIVGASTTPPLIPDIAKMDWKLVQPSMLSPAPADHGKEQWDPKKIAQQLLVSIDWEEAPDLLLKGDISRLPTSVQMQLLRLTQEKAIKKLAKAMGVSEMVALIAVLANQAKVRAAARIARAVLPKATLGKMNAANEALGF